jgi:hypothetical protein
MTHPPFFFKMTLTGYITVFKPFLLFLVMNIFFEYLIIVNEIDFISKRINTAIKLVKHLNFTPRSKYD